MRAARLAKRSRNSGRWRDWAASTASSINASAFWRNGRTGSLVPRRRESEADCLGVALGILKSKRTSWRLNLTNSTPYYSTQLSQCESITEDWSVAEVVHRS